MAAIRESMSQLHESRREVNVARDYRDYRANLHVHSSFSHDSRGQIDDIVQAAKRAGTQVIMFNEHPAEHYDFFREGHQGLRDGVLLVPGAETKGFLAFPTRSIRGEDPGEKQPFADLIQADGGLIFVSHLEERMDWTIRGITGVEIYNTHAVFKKQTRLTSAMKNPLWWIRAAELFRQYPQESFSAIHEYPQDYLERWDALCQVAPHTGVSANDSHQNVGIVIRRNGPNQVRVEDALGEKLIDVELAVFAAIQPLTPEQQKDESAILLELRLDRYENSLRHVGTHLLMKGLTREDVWDSLRHGRCFVAFDGFADSIGFDVCIRTGNGQRFEMGSEVPNAADLEVVGAAPIPAKWRLLRNGQEVAKGDGREWKHRLTESGVYRVELYLDVAGEERLWICSNPFYVVSGR